MRCAVQFAGEILGAEFRRSLLDLSYNGKSFDDYFCFASVIRPRCGQLAIPRCAILRALNCVLGTAASPRTEDIPNAIPARLLCATCTTPAQLWTHALQQSASSYSIASLAMEGRSDGTSMPSAPAF
jgi:hypothetical protein